MARASGSYAGIIGPATSMRERRVAEGPPPPVAAQQAAAQEDSESFPQRPDLILIDGGLGQYNATRQILAELGVTDVAVVAIAKGRDRDAGREMFFVEGREPFRLPPRDAALYFVQRLRDEAHRFAIGTHPRPAQEGFYQEPRSTRSPASARRASARCSAPSAPRRRCRGRRWRTSRKYRGSTLARRSSSTISSTNGTGSAPVAIDDFRAKQCAARGGAIRRRVRLHTRTVGTGTNRCREAPKAWSTANVRATAQTERKAKVTEFLFDGRSFAALLFDMDGTLISSTASAERVWGRWARRHGIDVDTFLPTIHGVRSVETIRRLALPGVDPEREAAAITEAEMHDVADIAPIPGAARFLASLPPGRWAIVTSAPRGLATARLAAAGMPVPATVVTAEDVKNGKAQPGLLPARGQAARRGPWAHALSSRMPRRGSSPPRRPAPRLSSLAATAGAPAARHPVLDTYEGVAATIGPDGGISVSRVAASASTRRA